MAKVLKVLLKFVAGIIWVYSYITLGAMMAVAATPAYFLARWAWLREYSHPVFDAFVGMYFSILGFFVFGLALMIVLPVFRLLFLGLGWKPHVGAIPLYSFRIWFWYNHNGMMFMFSTVFGRFARATTVYPWFLRAMGAKIGREVVFNTQHVYDLDILTVGDGTVIGANASILGHLGEKGKLVRQPITIGKNCTVGQYANIFPGVTMGDNCHVGAMSLVPKGAQLDADSVYAGIPARKVKDLRPGVPATSDDVSSTVGGREEE